MVRFLSLLLFLSAMRVSAQQFEWAGQLVGISSNVNFEDFVIDENENMYAIGRFYSTMDIDPGSGVFQLTTNNGNDVFIVKYTPDHVIEWVYTFGGLNTQGKLRISFRNDALVISGMFFGTADFDPGPGISSISASGLTDVFVVKFSSFGVFQWVQTFGSDSSEGASGLCIDNNDNVIFGLRAFIGTADFDPGPGVAEFTTVVESGFVIKLTSDGDFSWAKPISSADTRQIISDDLGNIVMCGTYIGVVDLDPGAGEFLLGSDLLFTQGYVMQWTANGEFTWGAGLTGNSMVMPISMARDSNNNLIITGGYAGDVDMDPGPGTYIFNGDPYPLLYTDIFLLKLTEEGNFLWARSIGSPISAQTGVNVVVAPGDRIFIAGWIEGETDLDPGAGIQAISNPGGNAGFILEMDANGGYTWSGYISSETSGADLLFYNNGKIYFGGSFHGTNADLDPTEGIQNASSVSVYYSAFIVELSLDECPPLAVSFISEEMNCGNAMLATAIPEGESPFSYQWEDALLQTTSSATGLLAGSYTVTVVDGTGCSIVSSVEVALPEICMGDFDNDYLITVSDLMTFIAAYGCQGDCCPYDLNSDNLVSVTDLILFITVFGSTCP